MITFGLVHTQFTTKHFIDWSTDFEFGRYSLKDIRSLALDPQQNMKKMTTFTLEQMIETEFMFPLALGVSFKNK